MKHVARATVVASVLALLAAPAAAQQAGPSGLRGELLRDVAGLEQKYVSLAEAMPAEKYAWRPGEGVRSASEVYMHVAAANYMLPQFVGVAVPEGVEPRAMERIAEKAQVVEALRRSFAHVRQAIESVPDAELDAQVKLFGRDASKRSALVLMVNHLHEHLGQSIAYARTNGVVPPWSAGGE